MTTSYSLADTLPKDAGGAKFAAWPNISTSQNDFSLPIGLGASTIGTTSRIHAYLGVANAVAGSPMTNAPAGNLPLLGYLTNLSSIATNNFIQQRGNDRGEAYFTSLSMTTSAMSGSTETVTLASGLLYRAMVSGSEISAGGHVALLNGGTSLANFIFSSGSETLPVLDLGNMGTCFGSLRWERRGTTGGVRVSCFYRGWGQG